MSNSSLRVTAARIGSAASVLALAIPTKTFAAAGAALNNLKNGVDRTAGASQLGGAMSLPELVGKLIQQAMGLLGVVLVALVIYAGFLWMTAQGSEEKIKKAKGIISSAVVGLVLIFAAYSITDFVVASLINAG